ncbi:hydrogenase maturation nickel metallochaperone HypA [Desulfacinum hydrothermale]|nr:hydrogenase maturation nickel metallochaperone HypA [Desulfacinum hydrothermale]
MAIAQNLLEIVLDESARHGMRRVDRIVVQVGALAAVVPEALTFCFQVVSQDTPAASARLDIETVPVVVRCPLCGELFEVEDRFDACPDCGPVMSGMHMVSGREMTVLSIEGEGDNEGVEDHDGNQGAGGSEHPGDQRPTGGRKS